MTSSSGRDQGIPVFMIGRSAENGKEILPALAPEFDSTRETTHVTPNKRVPLTYMYATQ